ncbi:MAG: hypothetical protein NTNFB02_28160 [Nitrospira sp.]
MGSRGKGSPPLTQDGAHRIELCHIAFYGRTLAEYLRICDVDLLSWRDCTILDCPGGASSFVAEARREGVQMFACDPLYGADVSSLIERGEADIQHVIDRVARVPHLFLWNCYSSLDDLQANRLLALRWFQYDYQRGLEEQRYVKGELPRLPFEDHRFDLVLSGHFLFTYSDRFDYAFHLTALLELFRVSAREVRIYPLQGPDSQTYPHMEHLLSALKHKGIRAQICPVPFEFQRGSNQMLRLVRRHVDA